MLARWARHLPAAQLHVVTVPPSGSSPTLLLERFCRVLGVDASTLVPEEQAANTSLGRVQAELLRRVNAGLPDELRRRQVYGDVGKRFFAAQVLVPQEGRRIRVPEEAREWCTGVTRSQREALETAGYEVVGDLDDLECRPEHFSPDEREPGEGEVAAAAVEALVRLLTMRSEALLRRRSRRRRGRAERHSPRALLRLLRR